MSMDHPERAASSQSMLLRSRDRRRHNRQPPTATGGLLTGIVLATVYLAMGVHTLGLAVSVLAGISVVVVAAGNAVAIGAPPEATAARYVKYVGVPALQLGIIIGIIVSHAPTVVVCALACIALTTWPRLKATSAPDL